MSHDRHAPRPPSDVDRRDNVDRRTEDRRAHDRYTPGEPARNDRRQGERRRERT